MRPAVYIPNYNGSQRIGRALRSLREQSRPVDVVVVDNGSSDDSLELLRERVPRGDGAALGRNLGFGPALNRAVAEHPADPLILLNNDAECEPRFVEALLDALAPRASQSVAGVLLQERAPELIDSAGVVADRTLMGFDYLHGEPVEAAAERRRPARPDRRRRALPPRRLRGGRRLRRAHLPLLRGPRPGAADAAAGARCRLAAGARALHAYSASLGAGSGAQVRPHRLEPRLHAAPLRGDVATPATPPGCWRREGAICAGQLLLDRTAQGLRGRLRGWRDGAGLRAAASSTAAPLLDISAREALRAAAAPARLSGVAVPL